jgi:hypothetical protein
VLRAREILECSIDLLFLKPKVIRARLVPATECHASTAAAPEVRRRFRSPEVRQVLA